MDDKDMHMLIGEIHSDVKTLLKNASDTDRRVTSLEKKWWTTVALVGLWASAGVAKALGWH